MEPVDHYFSAFSVDDDLGVLFRWDGDVAFLANLGSHDEVYWCLDQDDRPEDDDATGAGVLGGREAHEQRTRIVRKVAS